MILFILLICLCFNGEAELTSKIVQQPGKTDSLIRAMSLLSSKHAYPVLIARGFAENKGQVLNQNKQKNTEVKFLFHGNGINIQLKKNSFSYDTYEAEKSARNFNPFRIKNKLKKDSTVFHFHRVDITFPGANPSPKIIAEESQEGYMNYYNAASALGVVHQFGKIVYKNIYPCIDLVFENNIESDSNGIEYYFIIKPGGDARKIRIKYAGADTHIENHKIVIRLEKREIQESIPLSFLSDSISDVNDARKNTPVAVTYKNFGKNTYGFTVPEYDKSKILTVDPVPDLVWGTYYGGSLNDWAYAVAISADGTVVIGGSSDNDNFATSGAYQTTLVGYGDALIGKYTSDGNLIWMTYYGGESEEEALGICTDKSGNIYAVGLTQSQTGIATPGAFQPLGSGTDGFLAKFDASGKRTWSTFYGGSSVEQLQAVKADKSGNVFVAGWTMSADGIASPGCFQPAYGSDGDIQDQSDGCLARFDKDGNRIWSTYFGSTRSDGFFALDIDASGNLYAAGVSNSATNIATPSAFQTTLAGTSDAALLVKFDTNGKRLWSTYYGGSTHSDQAQAVTCDNQNNVIIGGIAGSSTGIATSGTYQPAYGGELRDGFVAKFSSSGIRAWGTYYGGNGQDIIFGLASDANNNILLSGSTFSADKIASGGSYQTTGPSGNECSFLAKLSPSGNRIWGTYYGYGGLNSGEAFGIACDAKGNVFVCGETMANTNVATCNAFQKTWGGNGDIFLGMFSETIVPLLVSVTITSDVNDAICSGTPANFQAVPVNGGTQPSYQWKVNGVNAGTNEADFSTTSLKNGDKVTCEVTSSITCIVKPTANSNVIGISINSSVVPSVSISTSDTGSICANTPVTFTAIPVNGGSSPAYEWRINGNTVGSNSAVFTSTHLANGDEVTCSLTNLLSCSAINTVASNSIKVKVVSTVYPSVTVSASSTEVCSGAPVTFTASAENGGIQPVYEWQINSEPVGSGKSFITSSLADADSVQCILIPDVRACSNATRIVSNKISLNVNPLPDFTIQPFNPEISLGDTLQLVVHGTVDISGYSWSPAIWISNTSIPMPKVWPSSTQTYFVQATSAKGCKKSVPVTVEVISHLYICNAFTPNNDGLNDLWEIKGLDKYPKCIVTIYDRFGELIYKSSGYKVAWDGSFNGKPQPAGIYVYEIDLKDGSKPLKGTVTLVR